MNALIDFIKGLDFLTILLFFFIVIFSIVVAINFREIKTQLNRIEDTKNKDEKLYFDDMTIRPARQRGFFKYYDRYLTDEEVMELFEKQHNPLKGGKE